MLSGMVTVQPDTECGAGERRDHHRPADEAHHPQAKPDAMRGVPPGTGLRAARAPTCRLNVVPSFGGGRSDGSLMLELGQTTDEAALHLVHQRADLPLP